MLDKFFGKIEAYMIMIDFNKRGIATAGLVGVLSMVLLLGIGSFALYSYQNTRTSTASRAVNELQDVDLGLTVKTEPLGVSWTGPENPDPNAKLIVAIKRTDGVLEQGNTERIVNVGTKSVDFSALNLPEGEYYAQLRYVPPQGPVLRDTEKFQIK